MTSRQEFREILRTLEEGVEDIPAIEAMAEDDSQFMLLYTTFDNLEDKSEREVVPLKIILAIEPYLQIETKNFQYDAKSIVTNAFKQKPGYILRINPTKNPYVLMEALKAFWDDETIEKVNFRHVLKIGVLIEEELEYVNDKFSTKEIDKEPAYYHHHYAVWALQEIFKENQKLLKEIEDAKNKKKVAMKIHTYFENNHLFEENSPEKD